MLYSTVNLLPVAHMQRTNVGKNVRQRKNWEMNEWYSAVIR